MAAASTDRSNESNVGRRLGRYELLYEIASGGMATVFLARAVGMKGFERIVAVKCCHKHLRGDDEFVTMFLDEARLAAKIHHPNVVATLDVGDEDSLYLAMEYVEGDRLLSLWKAARKKKEIVPVGITLRLMIDALNGLHAAHELKDSDGQPLNLVHRDVSPQNILVGVDGAARITDFGIAKAEQRATVTREGQIKGKVSYMAPEQFGSSAVTRQADVFAAGIVLWEMLTGQRLFRADNDAQTLNLVLHGAPPQPPSSISPDVTPELDAIVAKSLERDVAKRWATAADFSDALESCGVKLATTRTVATYIEKILAGEIEQRRAILQQVRQGIVPERKDGTDEESKSQSIARPRAGPDAVTHVAPDSAVSAPTQPARRMWPIALLFVIAVGIAVGGIAFGRRDRTAVPAATPAARPAATEAQHAPPHETPPPPANTQANEAPAPVVPPVAETQPTAPPTPPTPAIAQDTQPAANGRTHSSGRTHAGRHGHSGGAGESEFHPGAL